MEVVLFYAAAVVSLIATTLVISRLDASHGLIYLIISLLGVAVIFYLLGAPFAAALEVVIYAGAIMVLFLFVVMMLSQGPRGMDAERAFLSPRMWIGPSALTSVLFLEVIYTLAARSTISSGVVVTPKAVGIALFGPYILAVELASILLLAALIGAFHFGRRYMRARREELV
jgi:NADH-quinone oxidoreductase subunit J